MKRSLVFTAKAIFAMALLYFVWRAGFIDFNALRDLFDIKSFSILFALLTLSTLLVGTRCFFIVKAFGSKIGFIRAVKLTYIGNFFNFCIPGGTGGDIVKSLMLAQEVKLPRWHSVGIVFVDRMMGLFTICLFSFFAMLAQLETTFQNNATSTVFLLVAGVVAFCIIFYVSAVYFPKFVSDKWVVGRYLSRSQFIDKAREGLRIQNMILPLMLSLVSHFLIIFSIYYSTILLNLDAFGLSAYLIVVPVGLTVGALPITPAGIGVAQVAFFSLFKIYTGIESDTPATAVSVFQIMMFVVSLLGMYFYVVSDFKILKTKKNNLKEQV